MAEQDPTPTNALRRLLAATEFVAPNHDVLSGGDAIACAKELRLAKEAAEVALRWPIDHADLLRRYVALVVAEEGYDFLERLHGGRSVDGIAFTPEELAHLKALSAAANSGSAS